MHLVEYDKCIHFVANLEQNREKNVCNLRITEHVYILWFLSGEAHLHFFGEFWQNKPAKYTCMYAFWQM